MKQGKGLKKMNETIEEELKLWRPIFYRDKVTKQDIRELKKLILYWMEKFHD